MIELTDRFVAEDGLSLHSRSWVPATAESIAAVALLHGGAEHSGRYAHTAARFTAAGLQVDALDQRSHGASDRVRGVGLQIDRFDDLLRDTEIVVMVTHGIDEAILLSNRIVVMQNRLPFHQGTDRQRPSIAEVIDVPIERPRDRVSVVGHAAYGEIQARLFRLLQRDELAEAA